MSDHIYTVSDDSGFLALVDPHAYASFVSTDWTLDQIMLHFKSQMQQNRLAIWGTGREDMWRGDVQKQKSALVGFREFTTTIRASGNHLLLTNYESLTMAAQFDDVKLPESHQLRLLVPVRSGLYWCRVIQHVDPEKHDLTLEDEEVDFSIELSACMGVESVASPTGIPWRSL